MVDFKKYINSIKNNLKNYEKADLKKWKEVDKWKTQIKMANNKYFKYKFFRPNQLEMINATLDKKDVFGSIPTGGGKSLIFQLPSLV